MLKRWTPRRDSRPDLEVRSLVWYNFHHAGEKWCARPDSHRDCASLGPRMTADCRRAHGLHGRTCTSIEPLRRRPPDLFEPRGDGAPVRRCAGLVALRERCVADYASGAKVVPPPGLAPGSRASHARVLLLDDGKGKWCRRGDWLARTALGPAGYAFGVPVALLRSRTPKAHPF
jgi:hypothetical protein